MTTRGEILDFLVRNKQYFRTRFGVTKIGLFGSYATGEQNESSDIDLIVSEVKNILEEKDQEIESLKKLIK